MSNRYHIPVVVTTDDELSREQAIEYVESVLSNLEETDAVFRTFVEDDGIDQNEEIRRLLDMVDRVDAKNVNAAINMLDQISEDA